MSLPSAIDADQAEAPLKDGGLERKAAKVSEAKRRIIDVH